MNPNELADHAVDAVAIVCLTIFGIYGGGEVFVVGAIASVALGKRYLSGRPG